MKRMLLSFAAFLLAPLAAPAAPPNADRTAPPPELQLMRESILKEAATDLKLAVYPPRFESAVTAFGEFPSWILPVGNFNEAPPRRSHFGSLQFMCEGWIVFLDGVDRERLSDIPVLSEHSDAIDIDDPRTEGRRRKVRAGSETPEGARKAEGEGCALRRRVVDVVDVVGSSKGGRSKGRAAGAERSEKRRTPPRARGGVLAKGSKRDVRFGP